MFSIFSDFPGMICHDVLQTKDISLTRWLLYMQSKIKQVTYTFDRQARRDLRVSNSFSKPPPTNTHYPLS